MTKLCDTISLSRRKGPLLPKLIGLILLTSSMLQPDAFLTLWLRVIGLCFCFLFDSLLLGVGMLIIFIYSGMATVVQTKAENYIRVRGEKVPINMVPSGIKCLTCNQTYGPQELQKHLATHVNPEFITASPISNASTPEKPRLSILAEDPEKVEDIWVKSLLPADLPTMEREKKVANPPTGQLQVLKRLPFEGLLNLEPGLRKDISSNLGETVEQSIQPVQQLDIKKNLKLGKVQTEIKNKELHFYMNERDASRNIDNHIQKSKKSKDDETEDSQGYSVRRAPLENETQKSIFTPRKQNRQTYNISSGLKNPANALKISTLSRYEPRNEVQQPDSDLSKSRSTVLPVASRRRPHNMPDHGQHNHSCPCCKGFYCSYCKSSVPPIYRPVPDKDGNYHFHPKQNERAIEFYRNHQYPRDNHVCTACEKEMVIGRIVEDSPMM